MSDIIVILIVLVLVGSALGYIINQKINGAKCIGCPHSKECGSKSCNCK